MSAISEKVRKALFAKSNVSDVVGTGKLTGIHEGKAPAKAALPYGLFQRQAPGPVEYTFGVTQVLEDDLWLIKVLADDLSSKTKEPQEFAEDMVTTWLETLGNTLTLAGNTVVWMERYGDMPPLEELKNDRYIYHRGALLRIGVE